MAKRSAKEVRIEALETRIEGLDIHDVRACMYCGDSFCIDCVAPCAACGMTVCPTCSNQGCDCDRIEFRGSLLDTDSSRDSGRDSDSDSDDLSNQ